MSLPGIPEALNVEALAALRLLCARMEAYAAMCQRVAAAAAVHNDRAVFELSVHTRHARAAVATAKAQVDSLPVPGMAEEYELYARIVQASARAEPGDKLLTELKRTAEPPPVEQLGNAGAMAAFLESLLPPEWDLERDVVMLCGDVLAPAAKTLAGLGQRRLLFVSAGVARAELGSVAQCVETEQEVCDVVTRLEAPAPHNVAAARDTTATVAAEEFGQMVETVQAAIGCLTGMESTYHEVNRSWLWQLMDNMGTVGRSPSVSTLGEPFAGCPVVVVAAGPSLGECVAQLREFVGRALVVATSGALIPLMQAGVTPDLVVAVGSEAEASHFDGVDFAAIGAVVGGLAIDPAIYRLPIRRIFTVGCTQLDRWLFEVISTPGMLPTGGSAATTAVALAISMQCDPVITVGFDLCVSPDGDAASSALHVLPGRDGVELPCSVEQIIDHGWLTSAARRNAQRPPGHRARLINATAGGVLIDGMEQVPLDAAHAEHVHGNRVNVREALELMQRSCDTGQQARQLCAHFEQTIEQCQSISALARSCRETSVRAGQVAAFSQDLVVVERRLAAALRTDVFITMLCQREISAALASAHHAQDLHELLQATTSLCEVIEAAAHEVVPELRRGCAALQSS